MFQNEHFKADEYDYTMSDRKKHYPIKLPDELGQKLKDIADSEGNTLTEQVIFFLEQSISQYTERKC